jgi:hypothetical protein
MSKKGDNLREQLSDQLPQVPHPLQPPPKEIVELIPPFNGDHISDAFNWIRRFDFISKTYILTPHQQCKLLPLRLTGLAEQWFYQLEEAKKSVINSLKAAFLERFGVANGSFTLYQNINACRQIPIESVEQYAYRATLAINRVSPPMDQSSKVWCFIRGLQSSIYHDSKGRNILLTSITKLHRNICLFDLHC